MLKRHWNYTLRFKPSLFNPPKSCQAFVGFSSSKLRETWKVTRNMGHIEMNGKVKRDKTDGVVTKTSFRLKSKKVYLTRTVHTHLLTGGSFLCSIPVCVCVCVCLVFDKPTSIPLGAALSRAQEPRAFGCTTIFYNLSDRDVFTSFPSNLVHYVTLCAQVPREYVAPSQMIRHSYFCHVRGSIFIAGH